MDEPFDVATANLSGTTTKSFEESVVWAIIESP